MTLDDGTMTDQLDEVDAALRNHIRRLGNQLGEALVRQIGPELLDQVERVRHLSRNLRRDDDSSTVELAELLHGIDVVEAIRLVRAFTVYFHLANTAEQVHRVEDLRVAAPASITNRFVETLARLREAGVADDEILATVRTADLRPVFTAHPPEASRRSILVQLAESATLVEPRDDAAGAGLVLERERRKCGEGGVDRGAGDGRCG